MPETEHRINERMMARWTRRLGLFTLIVAIIAGITAYILYETDQTVRIVQRAFLSVKGTWWRPSPLSNNPTEWRGLPEWENSGATPIKSGVFTLACAFVPGKDSIIDPYALKRLSAIAMSRISLIIGAKQTKFGGQCDIPVEVLSNAQQGKQTVYVISEAKYLDIFGERHITRHCEYVYRINGDVRTGDRNIEVSGIPCVRHNCTDQECDQEDKIPNLSSRRAYSTNQVMALVPLPPPDLGL
jgi:hypothetical protein